MSIKQKLIGLILLLALITCSMFGITWHVAKQQKDDGLVINLAGRQRMLIQQFSKAAIGYVAELKGAKEAEKIADMVINVRDHLANSIAKAKETGDFKLTESMSNFYPTKAARHFIEAFSKDKSLTIRQVSIKYRNPDNKPDDYEAAVLAQMEISPEKWKDQIWKEKVIENSKETMRLIKPLIITKACLNCHGSPETIPEAIKEEYPGDVTTGYKEGDLRGAVSLSWPIGSKDIKRLYAEMIKTRDMFESSMEALINGGKACIGGKEFIAPVCENDQIRTQLVKAKGMWDKIVNATDVIFNKNADDIAFNIAIDYVLLNNGDLLTEVDKAVAMMQKQSEAKVDFLLILQIAAIAFSGCFVLFAIMIVIRVTNDLNAEIVERKEAEEQAHQAELFHISRLNILGEMASGLSHELNQPLCAILSCADLCLRATAGGIKNIDRLNKNLRTIETQAERAGNIIQHIRALVKKKGTEYSAIDINDLIRGTLSFIDTDIRHNKIKLNLELSEQISKITADTIQIEQVLLNLLRNAIEAMSGTDIEKRRLIIQTTQDSENAVKVVMRDSGNGLTAEVEKQLFNPFFTTKPDGLGVGLSISYSIIEAHHGELWAKSNPDHGSTFGFTLPVAKTQMCAS